MSLSLAEISERPYQQSMSLIDDIDYLCNPKNTITKKQISSMLLKYICCFFYPEHRNAKMNESKIEKILSKIIDSVLRDKEGSLQSDHPVKGISYPLEMFLDINSTTEIFLDIISRNISSSAFWWKYVGVDLWSWTWWLTLAQYIQARRNGFSEIENIGFELSEKASFFSDRILGLLWVWKVVHQDTTQAEMFEKISWDKITFVSNETLCDPTVKIEPELEHSDPFVANNRNLFTNGRDKITPATEFFPKKIQMVLCNKWERDLCIAEKENDFLSGYILDVHDTGILDSFFVKLFTWVKLFHGWDSEFMHESILIWENYVKLSEVWEATESVLLPCMLRPRWAAEPLLA